MAGCAMCSLVWCTWDWSSCLLRLLVFQPGEHPPLGYLPYRCAKTQITAASGKGTQYALARDPVTKTRVYSETCIKGTPTGLLLGSA